VKAHNESVIDKAELRRMSRAERRELASLLAELDEPAPAEPVSGDASPAEPALAKTAAIGEADSDRADPYQLDPSLRRERRLALLVATACCVILAGWIVVLAATLPHRFDAHHWRAVWVNFDVFLLAAFAVTAWAIWRQRQVLILLLVLTGTMLFCDAWFDVGTSLATSGFWISLLSAVFAELPLAILAFIGARRLLRATIAAGIPAGVTAQAGQTAAAGATAEPLRWSQVGTRRPQIGTGSALHRVPLAGCGLDEALPLSRAQSRAERAEGEDRGGRARQSA
jgi:hypothetical protein